MKKKLTTILLATLIILIGKSEAATLTQKLGNSSISASVNSGQQVTLRFTNKTNYTFSSWTVESGEITIDTTSSTVTFTMPSTDVVIKANYEEENLTWVLVDKVEIGDYVTYVPSSTSYTVSADLSGYDSDQTYNPSNAISWRVFSNDGTNVEIISTDSVGNLYLLGSDGYINAVQTLNDMASAYVNSTYAESGRSLGYYDKTRYISTTNSGSTMTATELANYKTIDTSSYPLNWDVSGFPYEDYQYVPDKTVLDNHGSMYSSEYVWMANRSTYYINDGLDFYVMSMSTSGDFAFADLWSDYDGGGSEARESSNGVRPVVTLKSGITVTGGSGTSTDPYTITY